MSQNSAHPDSYSLPDVIIHSSLAYNLHQRLSSSPFPHHQLHTPLHLPGSASSVFNAPSQGRRDRSRSGGQTPREMVWVDSKERLSEMATNIRGISNALSNVALSVAVKNILIVTKLSDDELPGRTREMVEWLLEWKSHRRTRPDSLSSHSSNSNGISKERESSSRAAANALAQASAGNTARENARKPIRENLDDSTEGEPLELHIEPLSCSSGNLQLYVEDVIAENPAFGLDELKAKNPEYEKRLNLWSQGKHSPDAEQIDLVITLGGDGTVLYTSWMFQKMVPPTLSFGLGSLGFMTENAFEDFPQIIDDHLTNGICCTLRMRFTCTVMRTRNTHKVGEEDLKNEMLQGGQECRFASHTKEADYSILNEVVVDRGPNPFVTTTELYGNYELLTCIKADGVVISTPTGSTAYSMSAGGSLVHPDIPAQLISPICPHTLSFRPLVVPDSMILHIGVPYDARSSAFVSLDGKARVELRRGDFLAINVSRYPFPKVQPPQSTSVSWVQQLSRTLHWNEQKRPKRYTDGRSDNWIH